jgi:hypothetical protein
LAVRIVGRQADQEANAPYAVALLRVRSERPSRRRTAEEELAPVHRISFAGRNAPRNAPSWRR